MTPEQSEAVDGKSKNMQDFFRSIIRGEATTSSVALSDQQKFGKFKKDIWSSPIDKPLYAPEYNPLVSSDFIKKQNAMLKLFNTRKDEVLAQRAAPGINQTRY